MANLDRVLPVSSADSNALPAADQQLDASGLTCPMPLLKAKQALNRLAPGSVLEVRATDPGSERDFEVFARQSGHDLLQSRREDDCFIYLVRKAH